MAAHETPRAGRPGAVGGRGVRVSPAAVPTVALADGHRMPVLGFGVYKVAPGGTEAAVGAALAAGYRLIDTAALYANEAGVGRAVKASGVPREDLFVTTKVWNTDQGYDATLRAFDVSLGELGLDRVDLYLVHWPMERRGLYRETWRALERLHADGLARSIGVSNFNPGHLDRLLAAARVAPVLNQVELHPGLRQDAVRAANAAHGIVTQAWSPLGQGKGLLADARVTALADALGRTPAQVVLRWILQLGVAALPRSVRPERIRANLDVFGFELTQPQMDVLTAFGDGNRVGPDPDAYGNP